MCGSCASVYDCVYGFCTSHNSWFCSSQGSQVVSEEVVDNVNLDNKASEESEEKTSSEGSPKAAVSGSETPERRELEVSDAAGILLFGPFKTLEKN